MSSKRIKHGPNYAVRSEFSTANHWRENQLAIFEIHLHFPVVRVLKKSMLRSRALRGLVFAFASFDKTHLVLLSGDISKASRLLAVEVANKFQECLFNVKEDRVVPPRVATLIKSEFAVYKKVVQGTGAGIAEGTR